MVHQNSKIAATLEYSSLFNTGFFFQPSDELAFFEASIDLDGLTVRVEEDWDGLPVESACHLQWTMILEATELRDCSDKPEVSYLNDSQLQTIYEQ